MDLHERSRLIARLTDPSSPSQFYRRLYGLRDGEPALEIASEDAWQRLPPLTKEDLLAQPLRERTHVPLGELDHLRPSSGTSGRGALFSPRTHVRGMEYRRTFHDFSSPFMAFTVPMMPHWHERFQAEYGTRAAVVVFDPAAPDASVRLAKLAGVEAFSVFVYHVPSIAEAMKREGMCGSIRLIEVTGETCPRGMYEYIRATFPNAVIVQSYNSSEVEDAHIGMPCKPMDGSEPLAVYHEKATHHLELLDPSTGNTLKPESGAEGDLLVTAYPGEPSSFPLVRFRIGDTVRVVEERCAHGSWSFTVLGRTDMDFLKIPGGVLRADEIERVLRTMPEIVTDRFELHCTETGSPHGPRIAPVLMVEPLSEAADVAALAAPLAELIRVSPQMSYADGVRAGRYASLRCEPLKSPRSGKTKRMVRS